VKELITHTRFNKVYINMLRVVFMVKVHHSRVCFETYLLRYSNTMLKRYHVKLLALVATLFHTLKHIGIGQFLWKLCKYVVIMTVNRLIHQNQY